MYIFFRVIHVLMAIVVLCSSHLPFQAQENTASSRYVAQKRSQEFSFQYQNLNYSGLIQYPEVQPKSLIVIIPGHGKTNMVNGNQFQRLREFFVEQGLTVVVWDRAGCGKSEGEYEHHQPVASSAREALAAIRKIRELKIPGSEKMGFWGLSRGGWICPLAIRDAPDISFWISVSGTDHLETFPHMLEANFAANGRSDEQVKLLMKEWRFMWQGFRSDMAYDKFLVGTKNFYDDPFTMKMGINRPSKDEFIEIQKNNKGRDDEFDPETGIAIIVPDFDKILSRLEIPVLAIFGELDSQVAWKRTKALYEETIGQNPNADLQVKTFPDCNHSILKCETGAFHEDLKKFNWQPCDGYYEAMEMWLRENGFSNQLPS